MEHLQEYMDAMVKAVRRDSFDKSDQLSLGEIILKIEPLIAKQEELKQKYGEEARVVYDFEYLYPTHIDSWRGSYAELALNFESGGEAMGVSEFLKMLKAAVGKTFTGYKGGDYIMTKNTPVWVANYGNAGSTAVIDVVDNEYEVILITARREF